MKNKNVVHMLWVYGGLSLLEKISARSFIRNGFSLNIWTYGINEIDIDGATIRNAREVLPETEVFLNKRKSYASFADVFRYSLLSLHSGIYVDTDVVCLKHASQFPSGNFLVQERKQDNSKLVNNNVISYQNFYDNSLIEKAKKFSLDFPKEHIKWAELGPNLMTQLSYEDTDNLFTIFPPEFANHYNYWECPEVFITKDYEQPPESAYLIHLYNEMWRRKKINKNKIYSKKTLYGKLQRNYLSEEEIIQRSYLRKFYKLLSKKFKSFSFLSNSKFK